MPEARKASLDVYALGRWPIPEPREPEPEPMLDLYALAAVRATEVQSALRTRCKGCTNEACAAPPGVYLGRSNWDECPLSKLRNPAAREAVNLYRAIKLNPLAGFPDCMTAWGFEMVLSIGDQVALNDERRAELARKGVAEGRR